MLVYYGGGYWNFPKGKIEHVNNTPPPRGFSNTKAPIRIKETSFQAAVREIRGEVGIKLKNLRFKKNFKAYERFVFHRNGQKVFKIVIFYLAETCQKQIKLSYEHDGYGWFIYKEAMKILSKYKDSQKVLSQANNFLQKRGLACGTMRKIR